MLTPNDIRIHGVGAAARADEYETARAHYAALADAAAAPGLRALLIEARAALPAEFCGYSGSLAERIDTMIHGPVRGEPVLGTLSDDLTLERLPSGDFAWLRP